MRRHRFVTFLALAAAALVARPAAAHQSSVTHSRVLVADDGVVDYRILLSTKDLEQALGLESDRDASDAEIRAGEARLFDYVLARVVVTGGAEPCPTERRGIDIKTQNDRFVELHFIARCPLPFTRVVLRYELFYDVDKAHVGRLQITHRDRTVTRELRSGLPPFEWVLQRPVTLTVRLAADPGDAPLRVEVTGAGERCALQPDGPTAGTERRFVVTCPKPSELLEITTDLGDAGAGGELVLSDGEKTDRVPLASGAGRYSWRPGDLTPASMGIVDYVEEGIDHIFGGPDHIAFVVALLLVAAIRVGGRKELEPRGLREGGGYVLKTVTAFTVAHSLTLIAAALQWIELPSRFVESAIAASIVYVAVENIWQREPRNRWPLAFGFGLVHGMGFAAMLRPMLPPEGVVPPLLAFNVGVELGQIAIVAVLFPVLAALAQANAPRYRRVAVVGGSLFVGAVGLLWLIDRVFEIETISRYLG